MALRTPRLAPLLVALVASSSTGLRAKEVNVDFAHDVLPILKRRCSECHTDGTYKGDFSLDTRQSLIDSQMVVPGQSAESDLIARVRSDDPDFRMPPEDSRLTEEEIGILGQWVDQGLSWEPGFSFRAPRYVAPLKPRRPKPPPPQAGLTNPIDRLLLVYYDKRGLSFPEPASDRRFIRRLYLDVIGLLPSIEETEKFVSDSESNKRSALVRQLMRRDTDYADHWLTFWNDLLRNDYQGTGYIDGGRKQISVWLYQSLLDNKPYDQFVRELISPTPDSEGFIRGIKWRGRVNASQTREIQFSQNVAQVMLGINLKCASCHDSFIDSWKLTDAYGLAAVVSDRPLEIHRCDKPTNQFAKARFLYPQLGTIDASTTRRERLGQLAEIMTHPDNGRLARTIVNRLWQRLMGRGLVHPVDIMRNQPWSENLLDYVAVHLVDTGYDLKKTIELITTSKAYQAACDRSASEGSPGEYVFRGPWPKRLTAEQFLDAIWGLTGTSPEKAAIEFPGRANVPIRAALVPSNDIMRSLGRPNREQVVTTRPERLTTLQALDLANGQTLADTLRRGAERLADSNQELSTRQLIERIWIMALGRMPTKGESTELAQFVTSESSSAKELEDVLWTVFMLPEFQLVY